MFFIILMGEIAEKEVLWLKIISKIYKLSVNSQSYDDRILFDHLKSTAKDLYL